jgi:hypothetical protein
MAKIEAIYVSFLGLHTNLFYPDDDLLSSKNVAAIKYIHI